VPAEEARKLRILRVADVPADRPGGMRGYMVESGAALKAAGHTVDCWFAEDLRTSWLPSALRRLVVPWLVAAKVLASRDIRTHVHVVEIHEPLAFAYSAVRAMLRGRRLPACVILSYGVEERAWRAQRDRWTRRGATPPASSLVSVPLTRLLPTRLGLRLADAILVPSSADRDYLIARYGRAPDHVVFAPTGVNPAFFALTPRGADHVRLLFVGSWIDRKGTPELVEAWDRLARTHAGLRLTLAGTGVRTKDVLADFPPRARDRVSVHSTIDRRELEALLASHQIFVLPSWFEGLPLSLLEAAAASLPCVVCAVCGNLDVFRRDRPDEDGGLLVEPHDAKGLADAVDRLVLDPSLRTRLAENARERARAFTWERTAQQALRAYRLAASE
jgi:glycosyltransferase involved in cell wall biosynthesis